MQKYNSNYTQKSPFAGSGSVAVWFPAANVSICTFKLKIAWKTTLPHIDGLNAREKVCKREGTGTEGIRYAHTKLIQAMFQ